MAFKKGSTSIKCKGKLILFIFVDYLFIVPSDFLEVFKNMHNKIKIKVKIKIGVKARESVYVCACVH